MSTQGYFEHYRNNRGVPVCKKLTARPVIDRLTSRQARTRYKGEGLCLGAMVRERSGRYFGQVWAQAHLKGHWWIVLDNGSVVGAAEWELEVIGQALDEPLWESA